MDGLVKHCISTCVLVVCFRDRAIRRSTIRSRIVATTQRERAVIDGRVDLANYPHGILVVYAVRFGSFQRLTDTIVATEILEQRGWELVS